MTLQQFLQRLADYHIVKITYDQRKIIDSLANGNHTKFSNNRRCGLTTAFNVYIAYSLLYTMEKRRQIYYLHVTGSSKNNAQRMLVDLLHEYCRKSGIDETQLIINNYEIKSNNVDVKFIIQCNLYKHTVQFGENVDDRLVITDDSSLEPDIFDAIQCRHKRYSVQFTSKYMPKLTDRIVNYVSVTTYPLA